MDALTPSRPAANRRTRWIPVGAAVVSGLLLTLAFPPLGLSWLAWVALAPLYFVLTERPRHWGNTLWLGWLFGLTVFLVGAYWMNELGAVPWFVLACIEASPFALMCLLCVVLWPRLPAWSRPLVWAAAWVMGEWLRSLGPYAFPWFLLAASQTRAVAFLQMLSLTGQWGLSFAVALVGGLLGESWLSLRRGVRCDARWFALAAAGVVALVGVGGQTALLLPDGASGGTCRVAAVQGNVAKPAAYDESYREGAMQTYADLTRISASGIDRPDVIIWPETVVPGYLLHDVLLYNEVARLAAQTRVPLLVGASDIAPGNRYLNSAFLFDSRGVLTARYDKVQVVPIGEMFPLRSVLGSIYAQYGVPANDLASGDLPGEIPIPRAGQSAASLGAMICYDDVFPWQARARVRRGAQFLSVMTSDQTFGTTAGPIQHADLAQLRAVETHRWLVRAAATGTTEFIRPDGRIETLLPLSTRGVLARPVPLRGDQTLFVRWGDWWVAVCGAILLAALFAPDGVKYGKRRKGASDDLGANPPDLP